MNIETIKTHLGYILGEMDTALASGSSDAVENTAKVLHEMHTVSEIIRVKYGITHKTEGTI